MNAPRLLRGLFCAALVLTGSAAFAGDPQVTPQDILKKYDEILSPTSFVAIVRMVAHREDGSERGYEMKILKAGHDKLRVWFQKPSSVVGQEVLRSGDNIWLYLPSIKRSMRVANRDSFAGGDFNNADVLRVNYADDYSGKFLTSSDPNAYEVELHAKTDQSAYDKVLLWVRKTDLMPLRAQYFGSSGQMIRSAEFGNFTRYDNSYTRPKLIKMRNELVKARRSEMVIESIKRNVDAPAQRFTQADLGR